MKYLSMATCALVGATLGSAACAETAATLLFTQPGTQIMDTNGAARPAVRGDVLQTGERLLTPPGAISQIKLPDGSLIGMRPDSELKINPPPSATDKAPPVVTLVSGAAHIIGAELMDSKKVSNFTFHSGPAVLKLQGADLESSMVRPADKDGKPSSGGAAPGSYQRLLVGTGSVGNGNLVAPLAPREVSFVGAINAPPVTLPSTPPNLFMPENRLLVSSVSGSPTTKEAPRLNVGTPSLPILGPAPTLPPPTMLPPPTVFIPPPVAFTPPPVVFTPPMVAFTPPPVIFTPPPVVFTPPIVTFTPPPVIFTPPPVVFTPPPVVTLTPCTRFIGTTCVR